jgi:signal transduction histidine kinase/ligand-binding sensor domain-containing protein
MKINLRGYVLISALLLNLPINAQVKFLDPVINPDQFKFYHVAPEGIAPNFPESVFQDQYGYIWIGTQYGTYMYDGYSLHDIRVKESDSLSTMLSSVYHFVDDREGGLWLCSQYGLYYYDRVKNELRSQIQFPDQKDRLKTEQDRGKNAIVGIYQDSNGLYWIFNRGGGLMLYDREEDQIVDTDIQGSGNWAYGPNIEDMKPLEREDGTIWIPAAPNGLYKYIPETGQFINYRHDPEDPNSLSSDHATDILEDAEGNLWITTFGGGLNIMTDQEQGIFERIRYDPDNPKTIVSDSLKELLKDRSGNIWMAGIGFSKWDIRRKEFSSYRIRTKDINQSTAVEYGMLNREHNFLQISEDHDGHLWLRSWDADGLFCFNPESELLNQFDFGYGPQEKLRREIFWLMFIDHAGMAWTVSARAVYFIEKNPFKRFHLLKDELNISGSPTTLNAATIYFDSEGTLWTGNTRTVLTRFSGFNNNFPDRTTHFPIHENLYNKDLIGSIVEDNGGNLWIRTYNRVCLFDRKTQTFSPVYPAIDSILEGARIRNLDRDKNGYIWISTIEHGLIIYDPGSGDLAHIKYDEDDPGGLPPGGIDFCMDRAGNMWIGGFGRGITMFRKSEIDKIFTSDSPKIIRYTRDAGISPNLSSDMVLQIYEDSRDRIWIGTASGLNLYNPQTERFHSFHKSDGLPDERIQGIIEDKNGNLWISTMNGLCKIVLNPGYGEDIIKSVHSYGTEEGIEQSYFKRTSARSPDGWMYFGNENGIIFFHSDSIKEDPVIPPVHITNIQINDRAITDLEKPILKESITETELIRLPFRQNFLSFEYVALNYLIAEKNQYRYMMEGLDENWVEAGTRRFAEYRDLNPGEYTFRVIASNEDGLWNEEGASIGIIIMPPWYRSILAYFIYGLLLLAAVYAFIRWRTWRIRKERDHLELQVKERTAVIENQKEEILTTNKTLEQQKEELQITLENLQQTQTQLIQSEKLAALGGLVAGVAHEINTPVGISVTAASSLAEETQEMANKYKQNKISRAEFKDYLNTANQSAKLILSNMEKAATMVQSFKQVSVDQSTEQKRKFKLKEYSEDVFRSLYPKLKGKKIKISLDINEKLELDSFPGAWSQILTNLVLNSLVHGFENSKHGEIKFSARIDEGELKLFYSDNGKGIPAEHLDKIYEPFFTTNKKAGTGLGMHIVYNLVVQRLNGTISCKSEEGGGVHIDIIIPIS